MYRHTGPRIASTYICRSISKKRNGEQKRIRSLKGRRHDSRNDTSLEVGAGSACAVGGAVSPTGCSIFPERATAEMKARVMAVTPVWTMVRDSAAFHGRSRPAFGKPAQAAL
ncbi:MAG TPA: hypothetical protein VLM75_02570 [Spirochaetota bacterium]|nr:hypothetical protein [Spirochaetota bacterium]